MKSKINVNGQTKVKDTGVPEAYLQNINVKGGRLTAFGAGRGSNMMYENGAKYWNYSNRKPGGSHHPLVQAALGGRNPEDVTLPHRANIHSVYSYGNYTAGTVEAIGQNLINGQGDTVKDLSGKLRYVPGGTKNINERTSSNQFAARGAAGGLKMMYKGATPVIDAVGNAVEDLSYPSAAGHEMDILEDNYMDQEEFNRNAPAFRKYFAASSSQEVGNAINNVNKVKNNRK